jgi:hypothetical protein
VTACRVYLLIVTQDGVTPVVVSVKQSGCGARHSPSYVMPGKIGTTLARGRPVLAVWVLRLLQYALQSDGSV